MMITLAADPLSDLDWAIHPDPEIIWHLDFGWKNFDPFDEGLFNANLLAIKEFLKKIPHPSKVILLKFDGRFSPLFKYSEKLEELHQDFKGDFEILCAQLLSDYLHQLVAFLPEETTPTIVVEIKDQKTFPMQVITLCRRRFEFLNLEFPNISIPISGEEKVIVSLPQDQVYDLFHFGSLFSKLAHKKFKCIPEELLNEYWGGGDYLIVDRETLSDSGKRMLYGFEATEGVIVSMRDPLGFSNEISLETFLNSE